MGCGTSRTATARDYIEYLEVVLLEKIFKS